MHESENRQFKLSAVVDSAWLHMLTSKFKASLCTKDYACCIEKMVHVVCT